MRTVERIDVVRRFLFERLAWIAFAAALSGCATSAGALRPGSVSNDEGALFGHIAVTNLGQDVTKRCYVELTDEREQRLRYISLDKTGWIFASVKPGTAYLSFVTCTVTDSTTFNVQYKTRELSFEVPGAGRIAYFGHVQVEFSQEGENIFAAALAPPLVSALKDNERAPAPYLEIFDRSDEAVREYYRRYGQSAASLKPERSLLPLTLPVKPAAPAVAAKPPPSPPAQVPAAEVATPDVEAASAAPPTSEAAKAQP